MINWTSRLALAAATLAATLAAGAQAQDVSRAPLSGTVNLDAGFTPDPKIVSVTSGGRHDTSENIGGSCTGFVSRAPDVRVNYNTASNVPLIFSATADGDTTLIINGPDGRWYCNDDADGLNPQVRFSQPGTGRYLVWIGTFGGRENIPARLFISEIDNTPAPAPISTGIDQSLPATYGTLNLSSGFTNDPRTVQVVAGGTESASDISSSCWGYVARAPDVSVNYSAGSLPLIISAASASDTTLLINDPQGNWYCDDDGGNKGANPALRFDSPMSGRYDIWVGSFSEGENPNATLYVSELNSQ